MPIVEIDIITVHADDRGGVYEPLAADRIAAQRNVHVVLSGPGVVRGNHYHTQGTETIAVAGPALVRVKEDDEIRDVTVPDQEVYRFVVPANVPHAIKNVGDQPNVLVAFNTCEHNPANPDTVEKILIK